MDNYDIYSHIEKRTNGDVYIGVVGPVRSGKSTFVSKFVNLFVLPQMENTAEKSVIVDQLPQSGEGKTVTTTEPKFLPEDSAPIRLKSGTKANIRLIDSVGYMVNGALGMEEDGKPRMVKTPWREQSMTFEEAGEMGTKKVICDHSTIGILITTDGSFTGISREEYQKSEERVVEELKKCGKPFIIIYNTTSPDDENTSEICGRLSEKYNAAVVAKDLLHMNEDDVEEVLTSLLMEFPVRTLSVVLPGWMRSLPCDNRLIAPLIDILNNFLPKINHMKDCKILAEKFEKLPFCLAVLEDMDSGEGSVRFTVTPTEDSFFASLSELCGEDLSDRLNLMKFIKGASSAKEKFEKIKGALMEAEETGYGIVPPCEEEIDLSQPEMVKNGNNYGVKIKATAPSLHIVKVQIGAEVNSVVGKEKQCSDYVDSLKRQYEEDPKGIMKVDLFGRPVYSFVSEEIYDKAGGMKPVFREKLCKTVSKLVNEKKNALFCLTI